MKKRHRQPFNGTKLTYNAEVGPAELREHCWAEPAAQTLLEAPMNQLHLSVRGFHRVLKLARTIADFTDSKHNRQLAAVRKLIDNAGPRFEWPPDIQWLPDSSAVLLYADGRVWLASA